MFKKLQGKAPINTQLYEFSELTEHVAQGGQVGWLVDDGFVVIDVDNHEDAEALLKMLQSNPVIEKEKNDTLTAPPKNKPSRKLKFRCHTTNNGMHFIFKTGRHKIRQGVNKHTPVSIQVDTRTAGKGYIVLPINFDGREVLVDYEFDELSVIPEWLVPLDINTSNDNFIKGIKLEGDGRNDALLRQVFRCKNALLKPEVIKKSIELINEFLFDTPMSARELYTTILREEIIDMKLSMKESKFSHSEMAEAILEQYEIKFAKDRYYMYNGGVFKECELDLERIMIEMFPDIKDGQRKEVLKYIKVMKNSEREVTQDQYVNLYNGLYDLKTGKMIPHDSDKAGYNQMNFSYDDEKRVIEVDQFLLDIANGNEDRRDLLLQVIGYSLTKSVREQIMFFLHGASAQNGKSTFLEVLQTLVGENNYSSLSLEDINKGGFELPEIDGKTLNIQADISGTFIKELSHIKNLTTGDSMSVARKFGQPFTMHPYAKFMFSANELPKSTKDTGWYRRLMIITLDKEFTGDDFDIETVKHQDALNYLGSIALDAYQKLYVQPPVKPEKWANASETEANLNRYKEDTDSVLAFIRNKVYQEKEVEFWEHKQVFLRSKSSMYDDYVDYCEDGHQKPKSKIAFGATVKDHFDGFIKDNKHYWSIPYEQVNITGNSKKLELNRR